MSDYGKNLAKILGKKKADLVLREVATMEDLMIFGESKIPMIRGCSLVTHDKIQAALELGREMISVSRKKGMGKLTSPDDVAYLMYPEYAGLMQEEFKVILLDTKNRLISIESVAKGTLNAAMIHPRNVFQKAIVMHAAGLIITHNHPTGYPEPSREDKELTDRFDRCADLIGIDLIDHIIIGDNCYVSMRERGLVSGGRNK